MRALVGWILALGLVVSPAVAKAGGAAGEGSPATAKTDQPVTPATTAPAANSTAAPAKPAAANLESELDELRDVLQTQAKQIQEQNDALKQQQAQMEALEKQLKASASTDATAPAAPATTTMASAAFPSPAPAASSPAPAPAAAAPQGEQPSPLYFSIGGAHFTPGGFLDLTDVFRTEATGNGIGSNFGAIPYNNVFPTAGLTEDRFSLQNSRLTLRVDSKVAGGDAVGYLEADFLGNAAASLNVTSNSNTLRMRVYFLDYRKGKFEILAGQDWSMLTANRTGIGFMPGDVFNTQDFDTNYQMGLVWERTPQFRFIVHPNKTVAFGVSIEDPEQYVTSAVTLPASFASSQINVGGTATAANVAPDIVAKLAFDPKFGTRSSHFEVVGLERTFRINSASGSGAGPTNFGNTTITGAGVAFNSNFEIFKNFKLYETAFWSDGGGREIGNAGVPDFIVTAPPSGGTAATAGNLYGLSAVHSGSGIAGFEYQTTPKLLLYGYFSGVYVDRNFGSTSSTTTCPSACLGYGFPLTSPTSANRLMHEGTIGWVQYFWRNPNYGAFSMISQLSYLDRYPWDPGNTGGNAPKDAHDVSAWIDLRYTLP